MMFSTKDLERKAKEQKKERDERAKKLGELSVKLIDWLKAQDITVHEAGAMIQIVSQTFQKQMDSKTNPIVAEWNNKKVTEFYANQDEPTATA
jgi:hypothetical protein